MRRTDRPMLHTDNPEQTLRDLIALRDPVYAEADITILSRDVPHDHITSEIIARVSHHSACRSRKERIASDC